MLKKFMIVLLIVAVLLGVGAGYGVFTYLQREVRGATILVSARSIKPGEQVAETDVRNEAIPRRFAGVGQYAVPPENANVIIGRTAQVAINEGDLILYSYFDPATPKRELFARMGPDDRAFTMSVDAESAVANIIEPGDTVDVIGTFEPEQKPTEMLGDSEEATSAPTSAREGNQTGSQGASQAPSTAGSEQVKDILSQLRGVSEKLDNAAPSGASIPPASVPIAPPPRDNVGSKLHTRTLLRGVYVLGVGQRFTPARYSPEGGETGSYGNITVRVTPYEAELLTFAQQIGGRITLTLRPPDAKDSGPPAQKVDYETFLQYTASGPIAASGKQEAPSPGTDGKP